MSAADTTVGWSKTVDEAAEAAYAVLRGVEVPFTNLATVDGSPNSDAFEIARVVLDSVLPPITTVAALQQMPPGTKVVDDATGWVWSRYRPPYIADDPAGIEAAVSAGIEVDRWRCDGRGVGRWHIRSAALMHSWRTGTLRQLRVGRR